MFSNQCEIKLQTTVLKLGEGIQNILYLSNIFPNHPCTKRDTRNFEINNHGREHILKPPVCIKSLSQRIYGHKYARKTKAHDLSIHLKKFKPKTRM